MRKALFLTLFTLLVTVFSFAQNANVHFTLLNSNAQELTLRVDFPDYQTSAVDVNGTTMYRLKMEGAYPMEVTGAPELLSTATSLIIPEGCQPTVEILESSSTEVANFELAPSKGVITRNIDPSTIAYVKGASYFMNRTQYNDTVALGEPYQLRDFHGMSLRFFPFAYNPVQKTLKAYSSITVKVRFNGNRAINFPTKVVSTFNKIYSDHFLNYSQLRSTPLEEEGAILILCPANFCDAMQPYVDWKIKNGFPTELVQLSTAGSNSTQIKNYISNYYNSHSNLAFVLLVGDSGQFPAPIVSGNYSDNYYAEIAGSDNYPDVIIGKISAETVDHVNIQVQKFIRYEQNPIELNHFDKFCGVASSEGPGDNNEYDYQHIRNIDNKLLNYTYIDGYEVFDGSQGGLDAAGNGTAAQVTAAVNEGVGIMNYTGHGSDTYWVSSNFSNTHISNLTNYDKLPFIFSVACVNGNYSGQTCFAEAWLRANKNGKPTGAVGALMSTINQPWNSPMCAQDHMINILTGSNNTQQRYTYGGIIFNGIIKMLDQYNDAEVARTWILFGDPTLLIRTATPTQLTVSHDDQLLFGTESISFTCPVENAKITITHNNDIISSGRISNGTLTLPLSQDLVATDTIHILAAATNYFPYEADVVIIPSNGPYLSSGNFVIHDNGNNDGNADYRESATLDLPLTNIGNEATNNIQLVLSTEDPYITILDSTASFSGTIQPEASETVANAFSIQIADNVPAYHSALFHIRLVYDNETRYASKAITLHAPELSIGNMVIDDNTLGNGNGKVDLHETTMLTFDLHNIGNGLAAAGQANLVCTDGHLTLFRFPQAVNAIDVDGQQIVSYKAKAADNVTSSCLTNLRLTYYADGYMVVKEFAIKIGEEAEDWESGDFSQYEWSNTSSKPWVITTQAPYEGNYCARSGAISDSQTSTLSISKYCSGGDSISFYIYVSSEDSYDYLKFYINNASKGSWCGEVGWTYVAFPVNEGMNTFKWSYTKDSYMSGGSDLAKIDKIVFPASSNPTAIEDVVNTETLTIMPNPTSDKVQILLPETLQGNDVQYQLFDLSGRMLQQDIIEGTSATLSLGNYTSGLYFIRVLNDNTLVGTYKIIKQ